MSMPDGALEILTPVANVRVSNPYTQPVDQAAPHLIVSPLWRSKSHVHSTTSECLTALTGPTTNSGGLRPLHWCRRRSTLDYGS